MQHSTRVLLVEDNENDYIIVRDLLSDIPTTEFALEWVATLDAARAALQCNEYDVCLVDHRLGQGSGIDLVGEAQGVRFPFILLTGSEDYEVDVAAAQAGAADYLVKGHINAPLLERSIRYAITHKQAEERLRESDERFRAFMDNMPAKAFIKDAEGRYIYMNRAGERLNGKPLDALLGKTCFDLFPAECAQMLHLQDEQVRSTGEARQFELALPLPGGGYHHELTIKFPLPDSDAGQALGGVSVDLSSQRLAEEQRDRFFTLSPDLLCVAGADGYFKRVNPAFTRTLGFSEAELLSRPFLEFVHPGDREATSAALVISSQAAIRSFENRYRCKDGSWCWLEWKSVPAPAEGVIYAAARDMTGRKRAEEDLRRANETLEERVRERTTQLETSNAALQREVEVRAEAEARLRHSEQRYRAIVESQTELICRFKPDGVLTFMNEVYCRYFGIRAEDWLGRSFFELLPEGGRAAMAEYLAGFSPECPVQALEHEVRLLDGEIRWQQWTNRAIYDEDGHFLEFQSVGRDITERKRAETALTQAHEAAQIARDEAERANRAKSEFLSRMSHELRTPMNAIMGYGQLLEMREDCNPKQLKDVEQILKAGRHLLDLINEVLEIARIEAGRLSLSLEPVPVAEVPREVLALVRPLAAQRDIQLFDGVEAASTGWRVVADRQRLKQVLLNLLSNAVKYNRDGGTVHLCCELISGETFTHANIECAGWVRFEVRDTGAGLHEAEIARLFVPFERLGAARTTIEGTGIGLALCKRLVEVMGGRIDVESAVGQGSCFWFDLPCATQPPLEAQEPLESDPPAPSADSYLRGTGTVLYIEDNLSNIDVIESALAQKASQVRLLPALQGSIGLDLARQHRPDLILLDVHLPDIMGDVVLHRLRAEPETRDIPVVVLSADAMPSQREKLLRAGARAYLTKPVDLREFFVLLREVLEPGRNCQE